MDTCTFFIKDKAVFGSFPTQSTVDELENDGFRYFVDLTMSSESHITPYLTKYNYINFPIVDRSVPFYDSSFITFVFKLVNIMKNTGFDEKVYLHCRGGHGRSGVVVSCLMCCLFNWHPVYSLKYTTICHSNRKIMRNKWRELGSPQTSQQKDFVHKICKLYILRDESPLSLHSKYPIQCPEWIGWFKNLNDAINYFKSNNICEIYAIKYLVFLRFEQHPILIDYIRKVIRCRIFKCVGSGCDMLCKVLHEYRMNMYINDF